LVRASLVALRRSARGDEQYWHAIEGPPDHSYEIPPQAIRPLHWFYADQILHETTDLELDLWDFEWRTKRGTPVTVARADVGGRRFRLVPAPDRDSEDYIFLFGDPLGLHFPAYSVAVIHTEIRTDLPVWLEEAIVWFVLAREFSRDSDHTDLAFAGVCTRMAQAELEMVQ